MAARFSFGIWDSASATYLAGETVEIKDGAGGTTLASTTDIGVGLVVTPNGDGTYFCDNIPAQNLWVYVDGALQNELANIPWANGEEVTHYALTTAHGSTGAVMGQGNVDGSTIEYSGGLRVKDAGIVAAKIGAGAVINAKLGADAVDSTKLADNAVDSEHYVDGSIDLVHLSADSVDGTKIADDSIDSEHYAAASIDPEHLAADAVTGIKIAAAALGEGLKKDGNNLGIAPSTVAAELDFEFNAADQLRLIKSLSSEVYITAGMTLMQMLSVLDNRIRQLNEIASPDQGSFYQIIYALLNEDTTPSGALTTPTFACTSAAYVDAVRIPVTKIPEMRQLVIYYSAKVTIGQIGYVKGFCNALSQESAAITNDAYETKALYLDISSVANWTIMEIALQMKIDGGTITSQSVNAIVRSDVTALSGETDYQQDNPVE